MSRRVVGGVVLLALGCGRPAQPTASNPPAGSAQVEPDPAEPSPRPQAELQALDRCRETMDAIEAMPAEQRVKAMLDARQALSDCGRLFVERCGVSSESFRGSWIDWTRETIDACRDRYCPGMSGPGRPSMCEVEGAGFMDLRDEDVAREHATEFIAAMLAEDYARPRTDVTVRRVSEGLAGRWLGPATAVTVAPPRPEDPPEDPLKLRLDVTTTDVTISGEGVAAVEVPAGDAERLLEHIRALKAAHPGARQVVLHVADDVPMQTLIEIMDTVRGEGCSAGPRASGCLFPDAVLSVE